MAKTYEFVQSAPVTSIRLFKQTHKSREDGVEYPSVEIKVAVKLPAVIKEHNERALNVVIYLTPFASPEAAKRKSAFARMEEVLADLKRQKAAGINPAYLTVARMDSGMYTKQLGNGRTEQVASTPEWVVYTTKIEDVDAMLDTMTAQFAEDEASRAPETTDDEVERG
jgi:hypothetical protein